MRLVGLGVLLCSAAVFADPVSDALAYLRQQQSPDGELGATTAEPPLLATSEAVITWRALGLESSTEAQAALVSLATSPSADDHELEGRRAAALRATPWSLDFLDGTYGFGFSADEPAVLGWAASNATTARRLAALALPNGCYAYADNAADAALTAQVAIQLAAFASDPVVSARLSTTRVCLLALQRGDGSFGTPSATALSVLALQPSGAAVTSSVSAARAFLVATQQSNGSWGSIRATALALRALALSGPDWQVQPDERGRPVLALLNPSPLAGEVVGAQFDVKNSSTSPAPAVLVRFTAQSSTGTETLLVDATIPALAPGERTTVTTNLPTAALMGLYTVRARIDPLGVVAELNEADNEASASLNVRSELDLALASDAIRFSAAGPGQVDVSVDVRALGGSLTAPVHVDVYAGRAPSVSLVGSAVIAPPIPVNGVGTAVVHWSISGVNGNTPVTAVVDPGNQIAEADERNNSAFRYFFAGSGRPVDVSLVAPDVTVTPAAPQALRPVTLAATVRNLATADALDVEVNVASSTGEIVASTELPLVRAGGSATAQLTFTPDRSGLFTLTVDPNQLLLDTNRGNNVTQLFLTVADATNLTVSGLAADNVLPGQPYNVGFLVGLASSTPRSVTSRIRDLRTGSTLYRNTDLITPPGQTITVRTLVGGDVAPMLEVCVDPDGEIAESNENDNCQELTASAGSTQLELDARKIAVSPVGPSVGERVTVSADVVNKSLLPAGVTVQWFLGPPTLASAVPLGDTSLPMVSAQASETARFEFVMPEGATPEIHARLSRSTLRNAASTARQVAGRHLFLETIIDVVQPDPVGGPFTEIDGTNIRVARLTPQAQPSLLLATEDKVPFIRASLLALQRGSDAGYSEQWRVQWPLKQVADFAVADLDGDGTAELAVFLRSISDDSNELQVLSSTGALRWSATLAGAVSSSVAGELGLGDFNGDGVTDLVLADGRLFVYSGTDGTLIRNVEFSPTRFMPAASIVRVLDVDGDGISEVFLLCRVAGGPNVMFLLNHDGTPRWSRDFAAQFGRPAIADINGDGYPDVVQSRYSDQLRGYSLLDGQLLGGTTGSFETAGTPPMIGAFRQDGLPYLAVQSWGDHFGRQSGLDVFRPDFARLYSAERPTFDHVEENLTLAAADLLGRGRPQIIGTSDVSAFFFWDSRHGQTLLPHPSPDTRGFGGHRYQSNISADTLQPPVVADLSADGGGFLVVGYAGVSATSPTQPNYGHGEALVFASAHWKKQPPVWAERHVVPGRVTADLRVHENYRWWLDHNTWDSQFETAPATLLPDLVALAPQASPAPVVGVPTTLSATIKNAGGLPASNFNVAFYDGAPDAGRLIATTSIAGPLAVRGGTSTASVSWSPTLEGEHQIVVVANPGGVLEEAGLDDNLAQAKVLVAPATSGCDLQLSSVFASPEPGVPGERLTVSATVTNVGDATCASSAVSLYRGSPSLGDLVGEVVIDALAPSASTTAPFSVAALPGTFVFTAVADEAATVPDVRRANNIATVTHSTPQGTAPDLVLVSTTATPSPAFPGESVVLTARVRNVGTPSSPVTIAARVGSTIRGTATVPPLLVGESIDVPLEVTAGSVTETYALEVDVTNAIAELSELNNTGTITVPVQARTLALSASATPSSAGPVTPIDTALTVTNGGSSAAEVLVSAEVRDVTGSVVSRPIEGRRLVVSAAQATSVHATFDTGLLPPGQYVLVATATSGGRALLPAQVPLTVLAESGTAVAVIAEKATYHQGDAVLLRQRATNLSRNAGLGASTLDLTVRDQGNVVVFASTRQLASLPARGVFDAADVYELSPALPPGVFTVSSVLHQGAQPLSTASTTFTVEYVASEAIRGTITAHSPFALGPALPATVDVSNTGALALNGGQLEIDLLSAVDLRLESQSFQSLSLAPGANRSISVSLPTTGVTEGMKLLVLRLDGRILDRTGVQATRLLDVDPPLIEVTGVFDGQLTNQSVSPAVAVMDASPVVVTTLLDGQPFVSGTAVHVETGHTLTVDAVDFYGNASHTVVRFTQDFTPPVLLLAGVAHGAVQNFPATLSFSATDAHPGTTSSTVDGVAFASGGTVSSEGDHLWTVTSTDGAGNTVAQSRSFAIDTTPPVVSFSGVTPGEYRNTAITPVVSVAEAHPGTVSALLDGQPYTLGTPVTAEGPHTLAVAAIDQAGNLGQAEISFTIATQPPTISITGVTQGATVHGPVALSFSVSGTQPITATATIDGAPFTTGSLVSSEGPHSFVVSSVDAAGNHATASRTFTIDTIAPVITLGGVIEGTLYGHAVSPTFAVSDLHLSSVSASLDGSPFSSGASVGTDGHHTLLVVASDEAGNSSQAEVHFTIDRTAPVVAIGGVAQGASVSGSVTPSFTVTDASAYTLTVTLDGSPFSPGAAITAEGAHTLVATATDAAGNVGTASRSFAIDRTAPTITITGVTEGGVTSSATPVVTVTDASAVTTTITLNGQPFSSGTTVVATGQYTLVASAIDAAGNTASATVHFEVVSMRPTFGYAACAFGTLTLLDNASVNLADGGTGTASAAAHGATSLQNNARVRGDLVSGGAFVARNNARVDGKLYSGSTVTVQNNATVAGGLQSVTPAPHPCECGFDVAARVNDALAHNDDQQLPAGFRGPALVVQNGQTLQLPAGRYAFTSVTVGNNASVRAQTGAGVELYVSGAVSVSNNAFLGGSTGQPPLLLVSSGAAVTLANNAVGALQIYAPSADLDLGNNAELQGAVVGHNIILRNNQQVRLVGAQAVPPPLTCQ